LAGFAPNAMAGIRKVLKSAALAAVGGLGLSGVPEQVVERLLEPSELESCDDAERWHVLCGAARDPRPGIRQSVAAQLPNYGFELEPRTEALVLELAHDSDPGVRRVLSASLGRLMKRVRAIDRGRVVATLATNDDPKVRFVIASALSWPFEAVGVVTALRALSTDPAEDVQTAALRAIRARRISV
jgi:hypothetical protein